MSRIIKNILIAVFSVTMITCYSVAHPVEDAPEAPVIDSNVVKAQEVTYDPIETYVRLKFGIDGERAMTMLRTCENKELRLDAINWNGNGTWDFGLFQINQVHGYTQDQLKDYKLNTDIAYMLYTKAGNTFTPWTCAYAVGDVPFYLK